MEEEMIQQNQQPEDAGMVAIDDASDKLEHQSWRNWFLLAGLTLITTLGLATAIPPLLTGQNISPWPWVNTDLTLLVGLSLVVMLFIVYLTYQQRRVVSMRRRLDVLELASIEHNTRHNAHLTALLNVSRLMAAETNIQSVFDYLIKMCKEVFECDRATLMQVDNEANELVVRSAAGNYEYFNVLGARQKVGEGVAGWAAQHKRSLLLGKNCSDEYPDIEFAHDSINSAMVTPIILRGELVGVINVSTQSPTIAYDNEDLRSLEVFAENAGTCIRHKEQANWMRDTIKKQQAIIDKGLDGKTRKDRSSKIKS